MTENTKCRITQLNPDCVRIQIAPEHLPMNGRALNKYGFIFEEAVKRDTARSLKISQDNTNEEFLSVQYETGETFLRLHKTAFFTDGALAEFDLFDDTENAYANIPG